MPDYTVSGDVDSMLRSANDAAIRSAIGVGTTDVPTFAGILAPAIVATGSSNSLQFSFAGNRSVMFTVDEIRVSGQSIIGWSGNATHADQFAAQLILAKDDTGILAQRNGTAKQALRVYNTNLSGAPEWAEFDWITSGGTNTLRIGTNLSGTGAARPIDFVTGGVVRMSIAGTGLTTIDSIPVSRGAGTNTNSVAIGGGLANTTTGSRNSAIGYQALQNNSTGIQNSAVGVSALQSNTTGTNNSAVGVNALQSNTTGGGNSAVGASALQGNTTGTQNSAVGVSALLSNSTGNNNSAVGVNALYGNTTGGSNSAVGVNALQNNSTGANNSAVGVSALFSNSTGNNNSAVGVNALQNNSTGIQNSAVGVSALQSNTTGIQNSAVGVNALLSNSTGGSNSAVGVSALLSNSTGGSNSAVGASALQSNTTGGSNSAVGYQAGRFIADGVTANATGATSIYLGADTKALAIGQTNQIVIGFGVIGLGSHSTTINNTSTVLTKIQGASAHVLDVSGTIRLTPPASAIPANNGELMVEGTSDTTLTLRLKGTDGIVRSVALTLA